MRIDQELVRKVLLRVEGEEAVDLTAYTPEQVQYHEAQLVRAGLLEGDVKWVGGSDLPLVLVFDLSWHGHEFLANARNDLFWKKAMRQLATAGGSASIEAISALLAKVAVSMLTN